ASRMAKGAGALATSAVARVVWPQTAQGISSSTRHMQLYYMRAILYACAASPAGLGRRRVGRYGWAGSLPPLSSRGIRNAVALAAFAGAASDSGVAPARVARRRPHTGAIRRGFRVPSRERRIDCD